GHFLLRGPLRGVLQSVAASRTRRPAAGMWWPADRARPAVPGMDRALREREAYVLDLLLRRSREDLHRLAALWAEDELRTLRVLIRGAAAGVPSERRLAGLSPPPGWDRSTLSEAARADGPRGVADALEAAGHPAAGGLRAALESGAGADLIRLEAAAARAVLDRALRPARRVDPGLRALAADAVDLANAWTALLAPGWREEAEAEDLFLEGGRHLDSAAFRAAAAEDDAERRRLRVAEALSDGPLGGPFADLAVPTGALERAVLRSRARAAARAALAAPLTAAPVIAFRLRLRAATVALRRIARGIGLGAPVERRSPGLAGAA
ncbi:MAG: V-type ATPase subunit, partial [Gemmatimonadota bacterium]